MAYPVTRQAWWKNTEKVTKPNTPAAIPLYGNYSNWIAVNGFAASDNPVPNPDTDPWQSAPVTIYGFWLTDPAQDGIGQHVYITAADANATYFKPMQTNDQYNGLLLQVAEPPPRIPAQESRIQNKPMAMDSITKITTVATADSSPKVTIAKPEANPENLEIINKLIGKTQK